MQLHRKKQHHHHHQCSRSWNIKGIVEESMHTYRDTRIGPRPGKNPLWGKPLQIFFFLDHHQMMQQKRVQWSITLSMQQNNNDVYETDLILLGIQILILMLVMCCHKHMSTVVYCCHCAEYCWVLLSLSMSPIHMFTAETNKSDLQIYITIERNPYLLGHWSQLKPRCQNLDLN